MVFSTKRTSGSTFYIHEIHPSAEPEHILSLLVYGYYNRMKEFTSCYDHIHYNMPTRFRYCLFDAEGNKIYTSPVEVHGEPLPEVPEDYEILYHYRGWRPLFYEKKWKLCVDIDKLVPDYLRHIAVKAKIYSKPDYDFDGCPPEILDRVINITPEPLPISEEEVNHDLNLIDSLPHCQKNCKFAPDMQSDTKNSDLITSVASTIAENKLLDHGDKVIVALSGGADSVALLAALVALGYDCLAAHCNFHLRGAESQRDMLHAQEICRRLGVDFTVHDFDVVARQRKTGESVEMACRSLRYEWFNRLLTQERARAIAVGHHREDNIETILLNLFRSTGIDGMRGIKHRRGYVIRPLLECTRKQIEQYLAETGLSYVVDSSNSSDAYLRNRLRNHVIPELLRHFPNADRAILASASNLEAAARIYHRAIDGYREKYFSDNGKINLLGLLSEANSDAPTVLRELLKDIGITATQCADIIASASRSGLRFPTSSGATVELDRGVLTIFRPTRQTPPTRPTDSTPVDLRRDVLTPVNLRISRHHITEFSPKRDPNVLYLDSSALSPDRKWALRRWREGDRFHPYGLKGSRLVSDLFSDAKYSAADKRNAWLLTCDDNIVWVIGLRPSSLFNVGPHTHEYLKILYKT